MNTKKTPLALIIVDGFGHSPNREGNAIALAQTPYYDEIQAKFPQTLLEASGLRVGLPGDVIGNSEVGHLNIGAGRAIKTDLVRINNAIETGEFFENQNLTAAFDNAKNKDKSLHLLGLVSDGQVHSSQEHLFALLRMAKRRGLQKVFVHAFLDGRDVSPTSAHIYLEALELKMHDIGVGKIASVCGRFYAMDRDNRWERTARTYTTLVHGEGERTFDAISAVRNSYQRGVTDEFVEPVVVEEREGFPLATIRDGDSIIFFNFRADRARQLTRALTVRGFNEPFAIYKPKTHSVCMTQYDKDFQLPVAFEPVTNKNVLADVFAEKGITNFRFAETEKYAHVTYFLNGGIEKEFACENRLLLPSPKVKTYDLEPEMSAFKITDKVLRAIEARETDVFIINFANCDMVGHTGKLDKTIEAVQYVDTCLGWITKGIRSAGGTTLLTSDHGNCEQMLDLRTGEPHTAHTTNLVPFHIIGREYEGAKLREDAALCDVAPTILSLLNVEKPVEMTGKSLLEI
ncbi:MAG: 2,3-bisphosphoglycerate-independent phosphoglycerate mutase [Pyrinomonadaceae bacterium]|nr:2,3-bisphosphoglycerate-independent phosphoglycerate mutase [Pyrinomonadaceae bacterium]